ncbi:hypothetical protein ACF0H5_004010 [Mactra antiquata]
MSDESKEAVSAPDTNEEEKEESKDEVMEEEADTSTKKDDEPENDDESDEDDTKKKPEKADNKKEEENDDENEDDEEESDDEPQIGLLEKPLVLEEGKKRERKKVERMTFQTEEKSHEGLEIKEGKGRSLGDIPYIEHMLSKTKAEDAKPLHKLLYRRQGANHDVKKNIRQFSGFPFAKDDAEYEKRLNLLKGKAYTLPMIKTMLDILDIPKTGVKDELITRLMEWLEKPEDSGRKIPQGKRKRKSKGSSGKKKGVKKDKKKEKKKKKVTKSKPEASDDDADMDDDDDDDKAENDDDKDSDNDDVADKESDKESDVSDDEEDEPPKKKAKKATPKPKEKKKPKQKATPKAKPAKTPPKKKPTPKKKAKVVNEEVSDISSDSDDEPLAKKEKSKSAPTNDELKDVVKKMLDNANLEQVTMKTVLKDVFAKYPDFDLTDRKDFIKNTVKQIIS